MKRHKIKHGFTIVELLIGILISGIIALGVAMVYFAVRNTQNAQNSISQIRDSAFIALDRIDYAIKHANFVDYNETGNSPTLPAAPFIAATTIDGTNTTINDQFSIQLTSPQFSPVGAITSEMVDCAGASVPANTVITQTFRVNNSNSNLECIVSPSTSAVSIASGVKNMQIFYSTADTNGCGTANASNPWKTATQIAAENSWSRICAINISLLNISQTKQMVKANDAVISKQFVLAPNTASANNDAQTKVKLTATSNLIENARVFNKVIHLRN